ncbi:hypothetical protein QR680_015107 [Steinernema hermaphroditum]|uniref:Uncharacterized protein n=1 Tax=Steinernema hermaphroditum TaxID=289476 RepID=A0AA39M4D0_9BILA|nr:hypothetical protein QR680_015107 [Steinernema hermaphroditum]
MDTVRYEFVEAVVALFGRDTLFPPDERPLIDKINNTVWKDAIQLHSLSRRYYELHIQEIGDRYKVSFLRSFDNEWATFREVQRVDRRWLRFEAIKPTEYSATEAVWMEREKLEELLTPQFVDVSTPLFPDGPNTPATSTEAMLRWIEEGLMEQVNFATIKFDYYGKTVEDFVKHQIENNPVLWKVNVSCRLKGFTWPDTILPYLKKFVLQAGIKRHVFFGRLKVGTEFLNEVLDFWQVNEGYQCYLCYEITRGDQMTPVGFDTSLETTSKRWHLTCYKHKTRQVALRFKRNENRRSFDLHNICDSKRCKTCPRLWKKTEMGDAVEV